MKQLLILAFTIISFGAYCQDNTFESNVRKMLKIQGVEKNIAPMLGRLLQLQREANPQIDTSFWNRYEKEFLGSSFEKLCNVIVPVYMSYLTENEVNAIIAFYESDAGKSLVEKTPFIMQESMEAGEKLGRDLAIQISKEVEQQKTKNFNANFSNCASVKIGTFKYVMQDSSITVIKRDNRYQYEYYKGKTTKYRINWVNDCKYTLEVIKTDVSFMEEMKGKVFVTNIYDVTDRYYRFVGVVEGTDYKMEGVIYRVE